MFCHPHIFTATVLYTTVAVMDKATGFLCISCRHYQCINSAFAMQCGVQFITYNFMTVSIGDNTQVAKAIVLADISDVANPKLAWLCYCFIPDKVGIFFIVMMRVGRVRPPVTMPPMAAASIPAKSAMR